MDKAGSTLGTAEDLAIQFREFYHEAHRQIFDIVIRQVWLERCFTYDGKRRLKRFSNSHAVDTTFGYFMLATVGISQKVLTNNRLFPAVASYIPDFFPAFDDKDPFESPEDFEYPYEHVTLDHMVFVQYVHDRVEMLDHAEKHEMNIMDFQNWAANHVLSYNDDVGKNIYAIASRERMWPYIKRLKK